MRHLTILVLKELQSYCWFLLLCSPITLQPNNESQKLLLSFNFKEVVLAKDVSYYVLSISRMMLLILLEPLKLMIFEFIELCIILSKNCLGMFSNLPLGINIWNCLFKYPVQYRDSGTVVFLWILRNFKEHLFYRTPPDDCFYSYLVHHTTVLKYCLKNEFTCPFYG